MLEIKVVMALTVRDFDVQDAYEEWDRKLGRKKPGDDLGGKRGMFGMDFPHHVFWGDC
jgi:hypothetical protein